VCFGKPTSVGFFFDEEASMSFTIDRERIGWYALVAAVFVVLCALAYKYARPAVPRTITMSTGAAGGAYEAYAKRYAAALAEEGITLKLMPSKGAVENLARLRDANSGVDIALIQNGLADRETTERDGLESLGSLFYEPVLVFYRPQAFAKPVQSLGALRGKRVAIGAEGSGTQVIARSLLSLYVINQNAATLVSEGGDNAARALRDGAIDAAIFVGSINAPIVEALFRDASLRVADLELAETYAKRMPQVSAVTIAPGVVDVAARIPSAAVRTVATTSSLIARDDLHPAVSFLLMRAASKIHGGASALAKTNEFPSFALQQDFPASADAERLLKEGTPLLYRYLPFQVANFVSRAIVFLIPLLALTLPLTDWIPKIIGMRVRAKLFTHYKEMKRVDEAIRLAQSLEELKQAEESLDELDATVGRLSIPNNYSDGQFGIRDHMDLVRVRIERKRDAFAANVARLDRAAGETAP
jgi:uncharacterized protein